MSCGSAVVHNCWRCVRLLPVSFRHTSVQPPLCLQVAKLPTAVLSTTKKAKERAKRKAEARAAGGDMNRSLTSHASLGSNPGALPETSTGGGAMDVDGAPLSAEDKEAAEKAARDAAAAEAAAKEKAEKEEAARCPFDIDNPARCASEANYVSTAACARARVPYILNQAQQ